MKRPVYLDYNATTPVAQTVLDAMMPHFTETIGNPSSIDHSYGAEAGEAVEVGRNAVASLIGASSDEIVFTAGASESNNLAILGTMSRAPDSSEIVVTEIEHPSVLEPAKRSGFGIKIARPDSNGVIDPDEVERLISPKTCLVSVMAANNETGAIQPIADIGSVCADHEVAFHTDATQILRHSKIDVDSSNITMLSLSAHKMYGPKGAGALFVRRRGRRARLAPIMFGGGHERNLRPGTLNVPAIAGLGEAAALAESSREADYARENKLKDQLVSLLSEIENVELNNPTGLCLPQTLNVRFEGVNSKALIHAVREDVAFSTGSACSTNKVEPSHVLIAQGLGLEAISQSVRLSFGRQSTESQIRLVAETLATKVKLLRSIGGGRTQTVPAPSD